MALSFFSIGSLYDKKVRIQGVLQTQAAAPARHQEEEKTDKTKKKKRKSNKRTKSTNISSFFPVR